MTRCVLTWDGYPCSYPSEWNHVACMRSRPVTVQNTTWESYSPSIGFFYQDELIAKLFIAPDLPSARENPKDRKYHLYVVEDGDMIEETAASTDDESEILFLLQQIHS